MYIHHLSLQWHTAGATVALCMDYGTALGCPFSLLQVTQNRIFSLAYTRHFLLFMQWLIFSSIICFNGKTWEDSFQKDKKIWISSRKYIMLFSVHQDLIPHQHCYNSLFYCLAPLREVPKPFCLYITGKIFFFFPVCEVRMNWFEVEMFQIHCHLHFLDPKQKKSVPSLDPFKEWKRNLIKFTKLSLLALKNYGIVSWDLLQVLYKDVLIIWSKFTFVLSSFCADYSIFLSSCLLKNGY